MPYKRRGYGRRRYGGYRKKRYARPKASGWNTALGYAKKAWYMAKVVKSLVNVERKTHDLTSTIDPLLGPGTGTILSLTDIAQGTAYDQRDGNSVKLSSVLIKVNPMASSAAAAVATFRLTLLWDKEYDYASPPVYADIFESSSIISPMNHVNGSRFSVLMNKSICLSPDTGTSGAIREFYFKLGQHIRWADGNAAHQKNGNLLLVVQAIDVNGGVGGLSMPFYIRVRYIDN